VTPTESDRQYEVIDMLISGHSWLRDRYARRALVLNVSLLGCVVLLNACVFIGDETLKMLVAYPSAARVGLGFFSVAVFFVSLVEFRLDWKGKAVRHGEAIAKLGALKLEYRDAYKEHHGQDEATNARLFEEYSRVTREVVEIPDAAFNAAKSRHLLKKELSKESSRHPLVPLWILRLRLRWRGIRGLCDKETGK
jgi:hypothetical protein